MYHIFDVIFNLLLNYLLLFLQQYMELSTSLANDSDLGDYDYARQLNIMQWRCVEMIMLFPLIEYAYHRRHYTR
jgi:hypothetical protein